MQAGKFEETLDKLVQRDGTFHRDAYFFVREAVDHTHKMLGKGSSEEPHHVTGQELLEGIRAYGLEQYGPMTLTVLQEWGLRTCEDFGEIVFNMVESNLLSKTEKDSRDDFKGGYDFTEAFYRPFLPAEKNPTPATEPKPTQV